MRCLTVFVTTAALLTGCNSYKYTGEPTILGVNALTGALIDHDVMAQTPEDANAPTDSPSTAAGHPAATTSATAAPTTSPSFRGVIPHKGEIISIVVNSIFLKYLGDGMGHHVLVYAEVYDDAQDDPATAYSKVLFNQEDQPSNVMLGVNDRILYGPAEYKGHPIRIKFYVVKLDKDRKDLTKKLISAVGSVATASQPEAAPAVGLVIDALSAINELTQDDFELRYDATLYPLSSIGTARIGDEHLVRDIGTPNFNVSHARIGQPIAMTGTLRTGSYVIIKRELPDRFSRDEIPPEAVDSIRTNDWTQTALNRWYPAAKGNERIHTQELLRMEGGRLYRIVAEILDSNGKNIGKRTDDRGKTVQLSVPVVPTSGSNAGSQVNLVLGYRQPFTDQTYVAFSVINGLPQSLTTDQMQASSRRDAEQIGKLLINPSNTPLSERIGPSIDAVAASVKTVVEQHRLAQAAAKISGKDPTFRTSAKYPMFWIDQLQNPSTAAAADQPNILAKNTAIFATLSEFLLNLPSISPDKMDDDIDKLKSLAAKSFVPVQGDEGMFNLDGDAVTLIKSAKENANAATTKQ